jgi:hypothetical protein
VLADFTNITRDPAFEGTLGQAVAGELAKSPYLERASERADERYPALDGAAGDTKVSSEVAPEFASGRRSPPSSRDPLRSSAGNICAPGSAGREIGGQ